MRSGLYRIRFVGGPWHNLLKVCELVPSVDVAIPADSKALWYKKARYWLATYRTKVGTTYYQYVHGSLIQNGRAADCTWRERFPRWKISRREMKRLRAFS